MKKILVLGAGRSSSSLISYLLTNALENEWQVWVGDVSEQAAQERIGNDLNGRAIRFDIHDESCVEHITNADIVISVLPAQLHPMVANLCLLYSKHLVTASYVSEEMKNLSAEVKSKGLLFLNECGLDPGIDHMSAIEVIDRIRSYGGKLTSFESFTGGLIAPETDPGNPWRYKFTWNPRNVVMAGQGTAKFLQEGQFKYVPYQQLFKRTTPVTVQGLGEYEGYANRDSLKYIDTYKLDGIKTMIRGTLRNRDYCSTWDTFVQLGCCDDSYLMDDVDKMTHRSFLNGFMEYHPSKSVEEKLMDFFKVKADDERFKRLKWSGFFDNEPVGLSKGTPAQVLEHILNKKWKLGSDDKDLIVMWHRFVYEVNGKLKQIQATLTAKGVDSTYTAMAQTVGLPLAIATKLILQNKVKSKGVVIPIEKEFYEPILGELKVLGIHLTETETSL